MEEWKEYKIGELCDTISDTYKKGAKDVVLINTSDVLEGKCLNHKKVPNENLKGQFKKTFQYNDILYSEIRPANKRFAFVDFDATDYIASTKLMVLRHNDKITPQYLYYILKSQNVIEELQMLAESRSGTFPQITFSELSNLRVWLPNKKTQNKIITILSSLDDKIEVNRRINEQLEELAQALFKSWFVDFEPFKDGEFVESELGMIPEGWKVGTLGDVAMITKGTTPTTLGYSFTYNGIPFIKAESIRDNHTIDFDKTTYISLEANEKLCRSIIKKYDILFTIAGTLGRFCFAPQTLEIANTNQAVAIIRVHKLFNPISIYSMLLGKWHTEYCYRNIQQAVQANLSLGTLKKMPILIPPFDIIKKYEECIFPIFMKFESLNEEITHLTNLRDTLLPKLMSGEIDVNEVEI